MNTALTIAGSDCSGGAGIQADLKTFAAHKVYGMSAITALTAQNTLGVTGISESSPEFLKAQLDAIFTDIYPDAVKIGMVASKELIETIADSLIIYKAKNIVLDPVMVSTSGSRLIKEDAAEVLKERLMVLADVITPNTTELAILADKKCENVFNEAWVNDYQNIEISLNTLYKQGIKRIVVTGFKEDDLISNIVFDNGIISKVSSQKVGGYFSGTGDVFASVLTGSLLNGNSLVDSCKKAGDFISNTIKVTNVTDGNDGISFEKTLKELISYEK